MTIYCTFFARHGQIVRQENSQRALIECCNRTCAFLARPSFFCTRKIRLCRRGLISKPVGSCVKKRDAAYGQMRFPTETDDRPKERAQKIARSSDAQTCLLII